jgi:hypothetical protein
MFARVGEALDEIAADKTGGSGDQDMAHDAREHTMNEAPGCRSPGEFQLPLRPSLHGVTFAIARWLEGHSPDKALDAHRFITHSTVKQASR